MQLWCMRLLVRQKQDALLCAVAILCFAYSHGSMLYACMLPLHVWDLCPDEMGRS